MASSLICATKKLSTILYSELTSMDTTMGSDMLISSGRTGFSFINVCCNTHSSPQRTFQPAAHKKATQPRCSCVAKSGGARKIHNEF